MMGLGTTAARLVALAACGTLAGTPFACGSAFSAGGGDAGAADGSSDGSIEAALDGVAPTDGTTAEGSGESGVGESGVGDAAGATVQGAVVDAYLLPMGGIDVHCQDQKATTADDGTFTLTGITKPYTATVVVPQPAGHKHGYVFEGISRLNPTLQLAADQAHPSATVALGGTLATGAPDASGIVFGDFPAGTPATASPTIPVALGSATYSGNLSWTGGPSATPTLYVLQWIQGSAGPSAYIAYESAPQTLTGGTPHTWDPNVSVTLSQGTMAATITPSAGYVPVDIGVFLRPPGAGVAAPIQHGMGPTIGTLSVATPIIQGASLVACGLQVLTGFDGGPGAPFGYTCATGLSANDSPQLGPPMATTFLSPPLTAAVGTTFTYQGIGSGVYLVAFAPTGSSANTSDALYVVTASTQAAVPDLSLLSFVFHTGDAFTAEVFGFAPFSQIDAALGAAGFSAYLNGYRLDTGAASDGSLAYSGPAAFTVK